MNTILEVDEEITEVLIRSIEEKIVENLNAKKERYNDARIISINLV
jgi:hypothetical protein